MVVGSSLDFMIKKGTGAEKSLVQLLHPLRAKELQFEEAFQKTLK